jgi:uncharacterized small protein (DUF1192 family)
MPSLIKAFLHELRDDLSMLVSPVPLGHVTGMTDADAEIGRLRGEVERLRAELAAVPDRAAVEAPAPVSTAAFAPAPAAAKVVVLPVGDGVPPCADTSHWGRR